MSAAQDEQRAAESQGPSVADAANSLFRGKSTLTLEEATAFAKEWFAGWNSKNLDAVMSHYHKDVVFHSPRVAAAYAATHGAVGSPDGTLHSAAQVRPYFEQALRAIPNLRLDIHKVLLGKPGHVAMHYSRESGSEVVEVVTLHEGLIAESHSYYDTVS